MVAWLVAEGGGTVILQPGALRRLLGVGILPHEGMAARGGRRSYAVNQEGHGDHGNGVAGF